MTSTDVRPFWLVIDIRAASSEMHSGVARFVVGLSRALGETLATRRNQDDSLAKQLRVLLVAKSEPPRWAVELIQEYPSIVSFWSGGPGALSPAWEKPQYLWSSRVLRWILKWSRGQFYWIAPGNFDRPVFTRFLLPRALRHHVVQVIHDTIPLDHARSMSFLFRLQFSLLVKRTLARFPFVITVSEESARRLGRLSPKRPSPIHILPNGVESIFGALPRHKSLAELVSSRRAFLDILFASQKGLGGEGQNAGGIPSAEDLDLIARRRWVVGVGRSQKYKGWDLAKDIVYQLNTDLSEGVSFFHVGGDEDGLPKSGKSAPKNPPSGVKCEENKGFKITRSSDGVVLTVESLPDEMLAQLYRCADVLVHPSQAEGFGFPPVEAALSGLPVVYRMGTAVDGHFKGHSFHPEFWQGVDSDDPRQWREALLSVLRNKSGLEGFMAEMHAAAYPRSFICQRGGGQDFRWLRAAENLLDILFSAPQRIKTAEGSE